MSQCCVTAEALAFLLVSTYCDTAQALTFLLVSTYYDTSQALTFLLVSTYCDTAQALTETRKQKIPKRLAVTVRWHNSETENKNNIEKHRKHQQQESRNVRHAWMQASRETDRRTDRQTDRQTNRQSDRQTETETESKKQLVKRAIPVNYRPAYQRYQNISAWEHHQLSTRQQTSLVSVWNQ